MKLLQDRQTLALGRTKSGTTVLCEPAQSKGTWRCHKSYFTGARRVCASLRSRNAHVPTPRNGNFPTPRFGHFPTPKNGHFSTHLHKIKGGILTAAKILHNVAEKRRDTGSFGTLTHISAHTHDFLHLYAICFLNGYMLGIASNSNSLGNYTPIFGVYIHQFLL